MLILAQIRHASFVRSKIFRDRIAPAEIIREGTLRTYWLLMNSFILMLMLVCFRIDVWTGSSMPDFNTRWNKPVVPLFFGGLAVTRDYLDYRYASRFLYPIRPEAAEALDRWPVTRIRRFARQWLWTVPAYIFMLVSFVLMYHLRLWDFGQWVKMCRL